MNSRISATIVMALAVSALPGPSRVCAQGIHVSAVGPVNRSMGGAGTAAPLDSMGSLFWNPASISGLGESELSVGVAGVLPVLETESLIPGFGSGVTSAEPGVTPLPNVGWVHHDDESATSFGLGVFCAAGFRTNFPASTTNPVFLPQSNSPGIPGGLGRVYSQAGFLEIIPTVSHQVTDNVSVGIGPTLTLGELIADPLVFAAPDDADGSGAPRYPAGRGSRTHWGGGLQAGAYYADESGLHLGASVKSPQWMETFRYHSEDEIGLPTVGRIDMDLPMIVSLGAAWSGTDRFVVATDVRYFDYGNTDGFRLSGFNADGSVAGLGWKSVFSVATGVQYEASRNLLVRLGYTFNQNPIPDAVSFFSVAAPLYYQHQLHAGASWRLVGNVWLSAAYSYYLPSEITGPIVTPLGAFPGSNVTNRESVHIADFGITVRY
ncbi:MAG: outer membrane protein transport protein [Planctomycetaceae bacterium]